MNLNSEQVKQILQHLPYPIGKQQLVQVAQQHNVNAQIVSLLQLLPDKTYNSADDVQRDLSSLSNLGNLGGFKL